MLDIQQQQKLDLTPLLNPRSVAVVGASEKSFFGLMLQKNLKAFGYEGKIFPINPRYQEILGRRAFPTLTSLPEAPDNVVIIIKRELVLGVVKEAIAIGAKSATIITAGFSETNEEEWKRAEEELRNLSITNNFPILGPNGLGIFSAHQRFGGFTAPLRGGMIPGNIALIMQSGGILQGMCLPFYQRGIGLSYAISSGNTMCLDISDYIEFLLTDEHTDVICGYIEGIKQPEKFVRTLKKAAEVGKPIIILKVGKSAKAAQATLAHTGSLAGADNVINAIFEKYGVIRVSDFDELVETAAMFSFKKCIPNISDDAGIGIITGSGGAVGLVNDLAEEFGVNIAELSEETSKRLKAVLPPSANVSNPVDVTGQILNDVEMYRKTIQILNDDPKVGVIVDLMPLGLASNDIPVHQKLLYETVAIAETISKPVILNALNSHSLDDWQKNFLESHKQVGFTQGVGKTLTAIQKLLN